MPRGRPSRDTIFDRCASALDELQRFGGLPRPAEAGGIWDDIWHLEAHNSTAIEGNTLVLREVERLLDTGQAIDTANSLTERIGSGAIAARDLPIELARIHTAFERIHPFIDGNGRAGRLALNLILVRLGFPPAIIFKRDPREISDRARPGRQG